MPKKFSGVNSKAEAAKAAKAEKAEAEKMKKKKAEEDAAWEDNDKSLAKKQVRELEQFVVRLIHSFVHAFSESKRRCRA